MSNVDQVTETLASTHIEQPAGTTNAGNTAGNEAVLAVVAEGRRLYIGNLAYATTEENLQEFFKGYLV
jgi:RNA recognition motif-containing protein